MKPRTILASALLVSLIACHSADTPPAAPTHDLPKALKEDGKSSYMSTKRMSGNIVEDLYAELTEKNADLKKLENSLDELQAGQHDSLKTFHTYDAKNNEYYNTASTYLSSCHDSVLAAKTKALILASMKHYDGTVKGYKDLEEAINKTAVKLDDLHKLLKVVNTLPLIEKYQKEQQPPAKPIQNYLHQQETTIQESESLLQKAGGK